MKGSIGLGFQTALTTAADATSCHWLPFVSENITLGKPRLESAEIRARYDEPRSHEGVNTVAGDIVFEPDPYVAAVLAYAALGRVVSSVQANWTWHNLLPNTTAWGAASPLPPFTLYIKRDVGCSFRYIGLAANALTLDYSYGALNRMTLSVMGLTGSGIADLTESFKSDETKRMPWSVNSFSIAAAGIATIRSLSFSVANNLELQDGLAGVVYPQRIKKSSWRQFRFNGEYEVEDLTEYARYLNNSEFELEVISSVSSATWMHAHGPRAIYENFPPVVGGPGPVMASAGGRFHYDSTTPTFSMICQSSVALLIG